MKIYAVGGSVRDELLGLPVTDRDYVVVGATPAEMVKLGYKPVGRDFPVFLHPTTKEEYALARTERKTARGYHGFEFHAAPDVTLEDDLARRDLTINAIARDDAGNLIDPFGGAADLKARVLRHVGPAFAEDPVRILRVARFAARFGFTIAPATLEQMRHMVVDGEADALVAERVWQELARGLMEQRPSRMFEVLAECGALAAILPELTAVTAGAAGARRLAALDAVAAHGLGLAERFAVLTMDTEEKLLEAFCERLRVPQDCRELALLAARHCSEVRKADKLAPAALLALIQATDALRRPDRFAQLLDVCAAAADKPASEAAVARLRDALAEARAVDAGAVARGCADPAQIKERVAQARIDAITKKL
jgi:tRNA nucleotidyltransferase (CCA-adding enzyme)